MAGRRRTRRRPLRLDQCWPDEWREAAELQRAASDLLRAPQLDHPLAVMVADHDLGIEDRDQRATVALASRREKSIDDCALCRMSVSRVGATSWTRCRARLASLPVDGDTGPSSGHLPEARVRRVAKCENARAGVNNFSDCPTTCKKS
jgi:hypothetical protein